MNLREKISQLEKQLDKYKFASLHDELTGLYNRRKLLQDIRRFCYEYHRYDVEFSLALLDVDNFKEYNDKFGHDVGDEILQKVTKGINETLRVSDRAYRLGGDEFVILLPHTNVQAALDACERIHLSSWIKVSYGVTGCQTGCKKYKKCKGNEQCILLKLADKSMYACKKQHKLHQSFLGKLLTKFWCRRK